jgi:hypothetical protein
MAGPGLASEHGEEVQVEIIWPAPTYMWLVEASDELSCHWPPSDHRLVDPPIASVVCHTEDEVTCTTAALALEAQVSTTGYRGTAICGEDRETTWAECATDAGVPGPGPVFAPVEKTCQDQSLGHAVTDGFVCLITPLEPRSDPGLVTQTCTWTIVS